MRHHEDLALLVQTRLRMERAGITSDRCEMEQLVVLLGRPDQRVESRLGLLIPVDREVLVRIHRDAIVALGPSLGHPRAAHDHQEAGRHTEDNRL